MTKKPKKEVVLIPAAPGVSKMPQNCRMRIVTEFDGGHRVRNYAQEKLTNLQWLAIASRVFKGRFFDEWSQPRAIVMTAKQSQDAFGFSARNFSKFLKSNGAKVTVHRGAYSVYICEVPKELLPKLEEFHKKYIARVENPARNHW